MFSSTTPSPDFFQFPSGNVYSRRLLVHALYVTPGAHIEPDPDVSESYSGRSSFDAKIIMIMALLLCVSISLVGLNLMIRCALRCSTRVSLESAGRAIPQLAITGVKRKFLKDLPSLIYLAGSRPPYLDSQCVICLSEFVEGDRVRVLPMCNHGFHLKCIDTWLLLHSSCPTCRQCLLDTCQKIIDCRQAIQSQPPSMVPPVTVPLELEGTRNSCVGLCSGPTN